MADYDPEKFVEGEMDITVQENTFDGFMKTCIITTICVAIVCVFLLIVGV
jgi:hypothetical protein